MTRTAMSGVARAVRTAAAGAVRIMAIAAAHGNMQGYANQPPQQQKTNTFAIVAFVQGILSVFLNSVLFFIPSVMAIVFGCISLSQLKQNPDQKGKGMAVAGLVLGIVFLILTIVLTILAVLLISTDSEFSRMFQEIYKQLEGGSGV